MEAIQNHTGQIIGYVRVSTIEQNTARQLESITLDKTFTDKASGKDTNRPQLDAMLGYVRGGDKIIVHSMDRLARNLDDLRRLVTSLTDRGIAIQFVKENLTSTSAKDAMSNMLLSIIGAVAEFEHVIIRGRQGEGITLAKQRGVYRGRKPSLNTDQVNELKQRLANGEKKSQIAKALGVSRATIYNYLQVSN